MRICVLEINTESKTLLVLISIGLDEIDDGIHTTAVKHKLVTFRPLLLFSRGARQTGSALRIEVCPVTVGRPLNLLPREINKTHRYIGIDLSQITWRARNVFDK